MTQPAGHPIPARRRWHLLCLAAVCTLLLLLLLAAAANATLGGANDGPASTLPLAPANAAPDQPPVPAPVGPRFPAVTELPTGPQPGPAAPPDAPVVPNAPDADVWYLQDAEVAMPEPAAALEALPARTGMGDGLNQRSMPQVGTPVSFDACVVVGTLGQTLYSLAVGDLDRDTRPDIVAGDYAGGVTAWHNTGDPFAGNWDAALLGASDDSIRSVAVGDLDKDAWPDIVSGDDYYKVMAWHNDGTPFAGSWDATLLGARDIWIYTVAVGDLDKDTWLDVVSGDGNDEAIAWRNDGTPFQEAWAINTIGFANSDIESLAVADLDQDGWQDVVTGDDDYQVTVWQNDGTPFTGGWHAQVAGTPDGWIYSVAVGDLDGDGWPDIVSGDDDHQVIAWQNDGTPFTGGWHAQVAGTRDDYVRSVAVGDLDGDGRPDIVSGDEDYQVIAWHNDGTPFDNAWASTVVHTADNYVRAVALADLDGDGDPDIVAGIRNGQVLACENLAAPEQSWGVFLPLVMLSHPGPTPGFWQHADGWMEFYVTADRVHIDDFAIYVKPEGCGYYWITHTVPEPILGNSFSFSGPFYASGTFGSQTTASGSLGLDAFYISGCGYVTGGPVSWTASWQHSAQVVAAEAGERDRLAPASPGAAFAVTRIR
jgi:hypothetical protein